MACCLEYLVAEVLESAGERCALKKRVRIVPRDITEVIKMDGDLCELMRDVNIPTHCIWSTKNREVLL